MSTYTTVKEMTDKVNQILELVEQAKGLASELITDNARNSFILRCEPENANEWRPIPIEERVKEADKYYKFFQGLRAHLARTEMMISRNY